MKHFALRTVRVHGHAVGYRRAGQGETVLLIHGLAGSSRTWKDVMPVLARTHDVIAPDLMGHGESAKPMGDYSLGAHASGLRDLLATLDVPSATMVGHSFGGGVAMQLAYQHPELCDRLVLISSGGLGREVSWLLRILSLPLAEQLMPVIFPRCVADRGSDVARFLQQRGIDAPRLGEMWRAYSSLSGAENRKAFVRTMRTVIEPGGQNVSALDRLYLASHLPTLIVWGERGPHHPRRPRSGRPPGDPGQPARDPPRRRSLPSRRGARPLRGRARGLPRDHRAGEPGRPVPARRPERRPVNPSSSTGRAG